MAHNSEQRYFVTGVGPDGQHFDLHPFVGRKADALRFAAQAVAGDVSAVAGSRTVAAVLVGDRYARRGSVMTWRWDRGEESMQPIEWRTVDGSQPCAAAA